MADTTISNLGALGVTDDAVLIPVVDSSGGSPVTRKMTVEQLLTHAGFDRVTGGLTVDTGQVSVLGGAGTARNIHFGDAAASFPAPDESHLRFTWQLDSVGNMRLLNRNWDGSILGTPFYIHRSTGNVSVGGELSPNSSFHMQGSLSRDVDSKALSFTAGVLDQVVLCNTASGSITVTLPDASTCKGREYTFKDTGNATANPVSIVTSLSQLIDGQLTQSINNSYGVLTLISDGANWFLI